MQGEKDERRRSKQKKRKKRSKFGYYLYAVVILVLTITNILLATLLLTHVQVIQVTGMENSKQSEIVSWVKEDPLTTNSIYTLFKFKTGSYSLPVYLEDVDVSLVAPWKVKVNVTEKTIIGCLIHEDAYIYFDAEGLVLKTSTEYQEGIPLIEGLQIEKKVAKHKKLQVANEKVFEYFVNVTKEIEKNKLNPDRLVWDDDSMNLYFEQVCVQLGKSNFDKKIVQLTPILKKLEGKKGVLHLEHYTSDSSNISFEENVEDS